MKELSFVFAFALGLAGCNSTINSAFVDVKAVAAKIDAWAIAVSKGAQKDYALAVSEIPAACSIVRTAANIANSAVVYSEELQAKPVVRNNLLKASVGLTAAGNSNACVAAANGIAPANVAEATSEIVQAFAAVQTALKGTSVTVTATAAVSSGS